MIDLHCHILPGIDDGAADLREALAMAAMAARDGIQTIIATPHVATGARSRLDLTRRVHEFNKLLDQYQIPVTVMAGAEVASSCLASGMSDWTLADSAYILVEFPHDYWPARAEHDLAALVDQGLRPIIAHPERNQAIIEDPGAFLDLLAPEVLLQITAGSVLGEFGPMVRECAFFLLQQGPVGFLATDAHCMRIRKPLLAEAVKKVSRLVGRQRAMAMVTDNPRLLLRNQPVVL